MSGKDNGMTAEVVGWQFKDDSGVWVTGSERNSHRQNTQEAGIEWRDLMTVTQHRSIYDALRAENAELVAALERLKIAADNIGGEHVTDWQQLIDAADVAESALAKRRGDK